jgi:hypothetical protein
MFSARIAFKSRFRKGEEITSVNQANQKLEASEHPKDAIVLSASETRLFPSEESFHASNGEPYATVALRPILRRGLSTVQSSNAWLSINTG